jgi:peptidoglycan/LPS O-acetylase OafA/YrhL
MSDEIPGMVRGIAAKRASLCSFDIARIVAISLVALQHLLTVSDWSPPQLFGCLDLGQLGVTIFCGLSGYFSLRSSAANPLNWLFRRLKRVMIPYWISLGAIFIANAIVGYKPATFGLIISEIFGTALFTHPHGLVGVHVWFISLILMCYGMALMLRWKPAVLPFFAAAVFTLSFWDKSLLPAHLLSFLAGCALSKTDDWKRRMAVASIIVLFCGLGIGARNVRLAYPLAATAALLPCSAWLASSPYWLSRTSECTYEFFLVHGPIYLGLAKFAGFGIFANLWIGTFAAILAAILLRATSFTVLAYIEAIWWRILLRGINPASQERAEI